MDRSFHVATTTSLTIDDFERLPADVVRHRELVDGELIDVSGNTPRHNIIRDQLLSYLGGLGEGPICWEGHRRAGT